MSIIIKRRIKRNDQEFFLVFDEYGTLDTVDKVKDGNRTQMNGKNKDVQFFVRNQKSILCMRDIKGIEYLPRGE